MLLPNSSFSQSPTSLSKAFFSPIRPRYSLPPATYLHAPGRPLIPSTRWTRRSTRSRRPPDRRGDPKPPRLPRTRSPRPPGQRAENPPLNRCRLTHHQTLSPAQIESCRPLFNPENPPGYRPHPHATRLTADCQAIRYKLVLIVHFAEGWLSQ